MIPQPVQRAVMMFDLSRLSIFPLEELDRTALVPAGSTLETELFDRMDI